MKYILILWVLFFVNKGFCINYDSIETNMYGETNYTKKENESLRTTFHLEYKIPLFEPKHKKYLIHFGGTVNPDYDHFGKTLKINGFTGFGIDF